MAVLWEQKKILDTLRTLQCEEMDEHASSSRSFGDDKLIYTFLRGDAVWWVEENVLIDRLMKDRNKNLKYTLKFARLFQ